MTEPIHDVVRDHYARAALAVVDGHDHGENASCCGTPNYSAAELASLPEAAALASLGCGNPIAVADLHEGERVLDLGSGGGIDVLLSAKRVGPTGRAFGLDMTDEMLALARRNTADAGATNVEFLKGHIEAIPLPADSIDVVISNCVINLAADKAAVFPRSPASCGRAAGSVSRTSSPTTRSVARGTRRARLLRRLHRRSSVVQRVRGGTTRRRARGHLDHADPPGDGRNALGDHPSPEVLRSRRATGEPPGAGCRYLDRLLLGGRAARR